MLDPDALVGVTGVFSGSSESIGNSCETSMESLKGELRCRERSASDLSSPVAEDSPFLFFSGVVNDSDESPSEPDGVVAFCLPFCLEEALAVFRVRFWLIPSSSNSSLERREREREFCVERGLLDWPILAAQGFQLSQFEDSNFRLFKIRFRFQ